MSMNRSQEPEKPSRFQLLRGNGEAERLDRFLAAADPLQVSSPATEARAVRRRKRPWKLHPVLGLLALVPVLGLSPPPGPGTAIGKSSRQENARLLIRQGRELMQEERNGEALANFKLAVQLAPDDADAWASLAGVQVHIYQSTQAERGFQRALALEPDNQEALHGLGNLYFREGRERQAERIWTQGGVDQQLARLYLLKGRYQQADAHLAKLMRSGAGDPLVARMEQAARTRRLDPTLRSYLEPEPAGLSAWAESGWRLLEQKRYEEAVSSFGKALAAFPWDVNALNGMGSALLALERPAAARPYFERALSLDGDNLKALNGRAACFHDEGKPLEAIAAWRRTVELYPGINDAVRGLALTYLSLQDYRQAALYLAPLTRKYPHDSQLLGALDVAVRKLGRS
jgi:tetratricopeptide (TPR) repeat protein